MKAVYFHHHRHVMDVRPGRKSAAHERDKFPETATRSLLRQVQPLRKAHVVYYLSRNGHLEHPHYMELTHFADQPLRLRDFTDRLTVVRGRGMPSLYAWSYKRGYKNGYVWNDLTENDIIHPCHEGEYVLKGSEVFHGRAPFRVKQHHHFPHEEELELEDDERPIKPSYDLKYDLNHSTRVTTPYKGDDEYQPGRSSVLLQLIPCGNNAVNRSKTGDSPAAAGARVVNGVVDRKSNACEGEVNLRKVVRLANFQCGEKEYYSGSIVDAVNGELQEQRMKKANSYGEDRSPKPDLLGEEEGEEAGTIMGKCLPRKSLSKQTRR